MRSNMSLWYLQVKLMYTFRRKFQKSSSSAPEKILESMGSTSRFPVTGLGVWDSNPFFNFTKPTKVILLATPYLHQNPQSPWQLAPNLLYYLHWNKTTEKPNVPSHYHFSISPLRSLFPQSRPYRSLHRGQRCIQCSLRPDQPLPLIKGYHMDTAQIIFIVITLIAAPYIVWDALNDRKGDQ